MKQRKYSKKKPTSSVARKTVSLSENLRIKCVYSGPVKVRDAPSGKVFFFLPGQTITITDQIDYDYLLSLNKKAGCCGGSGQQIRKYFEAA